MAKKSSKVMKEAKAFHTALDGDPDIRKALIERIVRAADKAPVVILHQVAMMLEIIK